MSEEQVKKPEETKKNKNEPEDLRKYKVDSIVNVVPLEPCIIWAAISDKEDEEATYKSIGIPGFYDPQTKKFITLDGGRVVLENFNNKLEEYVKELDKKIPNPQDQPTPEGFGG